MSGLSVVRQDSLAEGVAAQLRAAIRRGDLAPGARLVERRLATELGVSHIPVREAIATLVEEGLVVRRPRRGARVAELSPVKLEEISSLRVLLEQFVVRRVIEHWRPGAGEDLRRIAGAMVAAAERGDVMALYELDGRFHERLWQLADHALLLELASQLRGRISGFLLAAAEPLGPDERVAHARTHLDLVELLEAGDPEAACAGMREHIEAARDRIARSSRLAEGSEAP